MVNGNRTPSPENVENHSTVIPDGVKPPMKSIAAVQPITQQQNDEEQFQTGSESIFEDDGAWEQLMNHGSNANTESELARQSIFVKFDPLIGGASPQQRISNGPTTNPNTVSSSLDETIMQEEDLAADDE